MSARLALVWALGIAAGCTIRHRADAPRPAIATPESITDTAFAGRPFDTGPVRGRCFTQAPWGGGSWGVEGATFSRPGDHALRAARFAADGRQAYLWGRDDSGEWGFVRWIQGSAWAATNCGPTPWRRFSPIDAARDVEIGIKVYRDTTRLLAPGSDWILFGLNVWLASPNESKQGGSLWGRKPLVMDLVMHHESSSPTAALRHFEDQYALHYQVHVGQAPVKRWQPFRVRLRDHVRAAVEQFRIPRRVEHTLQITQIEFVIELRHAEGAASIDDFTIRTR